MTINKQFAYSKAPLREQYREDLTWDVNLVQANGNTETLYSDSSKEEDG